MPELSGGARAAPAGGRPGLAPLLADTQVTCGARKAGPGTRSQRCWPGRGGANPPPPAAPAAAPRPPPPAAHLRPRAPSADSRPPARPTAPAALTAHRRDCPRGRGRGGGGGGGRGRGRGAGLARRMGSVRGGCGSGGGRRTLDPAARAPPHARPSALRGLRLAERAGPGSPRPGWPRGPPVRAPAGRGFREPRRGRRPLWRPARAAACGAGCAERRAPGGGVPEGGPGSPWGRRASRGDRDPVAKRVRGRVWPGAGRCSRSPAPDPGHPRRAPLRLPRPRPGSAPPLAGPGKEATARGLSLREAGARIFNPADAPDLRPEKGGGAVQTRVRRRWLREGRLAASAGSWERLGLAGASPGRGRLSPRNGESGSVFPASAQGLASRLRSAQPRRGLRRASPLASQNMGSPCRLPPHRASPKPQVPALRNLS